MSTEATPVQDVRNEPPPEPIAHAPVRDFSQGTDNQVAIEVGLDLLPEWVAMIDGKFDEKEQSQIRTVTSPVLVIECTEKKDAFRDLLDSEKSAFGRDGLWRELLEEFAEAVDAEPSEKREEICRELFTRCVAVAEASGGWFGVGEQIGTEEALIIRVIIGRLQIPVEEADLQQRLGLTREEIDFHQYINSLSPQDRIRFLAIPQVICILVGTADGHISLWEGWTQMRVLTSGTRAISEDFPDLWTEHYAAINEWTMEGLDGASGENKIMQISWLLDFLNSFTPLLAKMPDTLKSRIQRFVLDTSIRLAGASGGTMGLGESILSEEKVVLNLIFDSFEIKIQDADLARRLEAVDEETVLLQLEQEERELIGQAVKDKE
jgi:hypothetical protein